MGMFDYVVCEVPLPELEDPSQYSFQSKSLGCYMDTYTITTDGLLTITERVPSSNPASATASVLDDYHGVLNFYDGIWDGASQALLDWYEYNAYFIHGKLEKIVRVAKENT